MWLYVGGMAVESLYVESEGYLVALCRERGMVRVWLYVEHYEVALLISQLGFHILV